MWQICGTLRGRVDQCLQQSETRAGDVLTKASEQMEHNHGLHVVTNHVGRTKRFPRLQVQKERQLLVGVGVGLACCSIVMQVGSARVASIVQLGHFLFAVNMW